MTSAQNFPKRVLVTAGLPYSNGNPHVGHLAGAYLPADIYTRYLKLNGVEARYVCGSDDYGVAILLSAEKAGKTPAELANFHSKQQYEDLSAFGVDFDVFSATSRNPHHHALTQEFFLALHKKGYFTKETTRQFYDQEKEMFLPDRYVTGTCGHCGATDQNGDQCEQCGKLLDIETLADAKSVLSGTPASIKESAHWFLDLSKFEADVGEWLDKAELRPHTRNFVKGLLSSGFVKRSMTRDIDWGVPVPLEDPDAKGKVLYVWFDAPVGYISNTALLLENENEGDTVDSWWKSDDCDIVHFIGEDNTIFHCIIWIAMLKAEGTYQLPSAVVVNNFLNFKNEAGEEEKFSKSKGNAIWLRDLIDSGENPDVLRYYLTAIAPEKARSFYSTADLKQRCNTDLANTIGNFVNRVVSFSIKHLGPAVPEFDASAATDVDNSFLNATDTAHREVGEHLYNCQFKAALERAIEFCRESNRYIDEKAPWATRKTDEAATRVTLYHCLHAIKVMAGLLAPFLPSTSAKMLDALSLKPDGAQWQQITDALAVGTPIQKPALLFEKYELE